MLKTSPKSPNDAALASRTRSMSHSASSSSIRSEIACFSCVAKYRMRRSISLSIFRLISGYVFVRTRSSLVFIGKTCIARLRRTEGRGGAPPPSSLACSNSYHHSLTLLAIALTATGTTTCFILIPRPTGRYWGFHPLRPVSMSILRFEGGVRPGRGGHPAPDVAARTAPPWLSRQIRDGDAGAL